MNHDWLIDWFLNSNIRKSYEMKWKRSWYYKDDTIINHLNHNTNLIFLSWSRRKENNLVFNCIMQPIHLTNCWTLDPTLDFIKLKVEI